MGKRKKSTRGQGKRLKETLPTTFTCLFCNHEDAVACVMDKRMGIGSLNCKVCGQNYRCAVNALSDPIDVYSDWYDACENVAAEKEDKSAEQADKHTSEDELEKE